MEGRYIDKDGWKRGQRSVNHDISARRLLLPSQCQSNASILCLLISKLMLGLREKSSYASKITARLVIDYVAIASSLVSAQSVSLSPPKPKSCQNSNTEHDYDC